MATENVLCDSICTIIPNKLHESFKMLNPRPDLCVLMQKTILPTLQ
jgi:hypothetical protein